MNCKWGKGHDILKCEMGKKKKEKKTRLREKSDRLGWI